MIASNGLIFVFALSAVGIIGYVITYLSEKGDITHTEEGLLMFEVDKDNDKMTSEELQKVYHGIANRHSREADHSFRVSLVAIKQQSDSEE